MRPNIWVLIILIIAALLMFGGFKNLPDAARSIGRSLRIFKAETQGLIGEGEAGKGDAAKKQNPEAESQTAANAPAEDAKTDTKETPTGTA